VAPVDDALSNGVNDKVRRRQYPHCRPTQNLAQCRPRPRRLPTSLLLRLLSFQSHKRSRSHGYFKSMR
jgi:hypothetical protein